MPSPIECPAAESCIARKLKFFSDNEQNEPSSEPHTSPSSIASSDESCHCETLKDESEQVNGEGLNFAESFWDSLINFMQESGKVMEQFNLTRQGMTSEEKATKMKDLLRRIEDKEKEIKQLSAEFRELVPAKKKCPARQTNVCPVTQGGECPDPTCDSYEEDFDMSAPTPYLLGQNYSQYPPAPTASSFPGYDPNIQSIYNRTQPESQYDQLLFDCDGMCQTPCTSNCRNVCNQRQQSRMQYRK